MCQLLNSVTDRDVLSIFFGIEMATCINLVGFENMETLWQWKGAVNGEEGFILHRLL